MLWKSQIQSETATSTMQSEVIDLAVCCQDLIPIIAIVDEVGAAIGLTQYDNSKMHMCIYKDNSCGLFWA